MSVPSDAELRDIACDAALRAGTYLREQFQTGVSFQEKTAHHDIVTACDLRAEAIIREAIAARCPDSTVIGEEGGSQGDGVVRWYVDPLDGTNNFAHGLPFFCVSIGAAVEGEVRAAAIYDPVRDELFSASEAGAALNGAPLRTVGRAAEPHSLLLTDYPHPGHRRPRDVELFGELVAIFNAVRRLGSGALALAWVAAGHADATLQANASPWDVAAGVLLVRRAGGQYLALGGRGDGATTWFASAFVATCPEFDLERSRFATLLRRMDW